MPDAKAQQAFYTFMEEYTDFLERMRKDEQERLSALESRNLQRIESTIAVSQANAKQLENYELKRNSVQQNAGLGGLSFKDVVKAVPADAQRGYSVLFDRFARHVSDIRFLNNKCMSVAKDGMLEIDPSAVLPAQTGGHTNPYQTIRKNEVEKNNSILETKV